MITLIKEEILTGVVYADNKPVVFASPKDSFSFNFISDNVHTKPGEYPRLRLSDGFAFGETHNKERISIYLGKYSHISIFGSTTYHSPAYIISNAGAFDKDITTFQGIVFHGGTLNELFTKEALRMNILDDILSVQEVPDCISFDISTKKYSFKLSVQSVVRQRESVNGHSLTNSDVQLTLLFETPQPLFSLFDHYNRIKELMSFMAFRDNVGFDNVSLLGAIEGITVPIPIAKVYIQQEYPFTSKKFYNNINFQDLGDAIPELLNLFYDVEDKAPGYSLGFYPQNDDERTLMDNQKIRAICSALECEWVFASDEIPSPEVNELLQHLIESTRDTVKAFRKSNPGLSNDTYNLVFSSIGNWSSTLTEKICILYNLYENDLLKLNEWDLYIHIDKALIGDLVKYRNHITHGRHRILDQRIAVTAHILSGLVYCCLLKRIGVSSEKITELCSNQKLLQ